MNPSIKNMMSEHRLIVEALASLDALVDKLQQNEAVPRGDVARFATFFQGFADRCHHGKEEDRLFVKLNQFGFSKEHGPVAVMLAEHTAGRAQVRAWAETGAKSGPLTPDEIKSVVAHGREFVPLLLSHIHKENHVLYPMAQQAIPPDEFKQLDAECEAFEREVMGAGEIQRLKEVAAQLIQAYPPAPDKLAAALAHL